MKKRVISAIAIIALLAICLAVSPYTRVGLFVVCAVIAAFEMFAAMRALCLSPTLWIVLLYIFAVTVNIFTLNSADTLGAILIFTAFLALGRTLIGTKVRPGDAFATISVCIYPITPILYVAYIGYTDNWVVTILTGIVSAAVCDMFAMFGGMLCGKHHPFPRISPNKTTEGSLIGFTGSVLVAIPLWFLFRAFALPLPSLPIYMLICGVCSTVGQVGDLIASSVKREAGIKDYGNLIPGHGGVMDRVDSHIFSVSAAYVLLILL